MCFKQYISLVRAISLIAIISICNACAVQSQHVNQFDKFAQAGIAYANAVPAVLDESFMVTVTSDSFSLITARPSLDQAARLQFISENNEVLKARLAILADLKRHTKLLRMYFVTLQTLAQMDAQSSGMTEVADGLVTTLGNLNSGIANASIGGASVKDLLAPTVNFAFTSYQSAALNSELRKNAATIGTELNLQQAMLRALADSMRSDLEAQFAAEDRDKIELPYIRDGSLPASWNQSRVDAFKRQVRLDSVDAAWIAAQSLRASFVAIVENRLGDAGISALIQDINDILTVVEDIQGSN